MAEHIRQYAGTLHLPLRLFQFYCRPAVIDEALSKSDAGDF
jgi:hypothetical protein